MQSQLIQQKSLSFFRGVQDMLSLYAYMLGAGFSFYVSWVLFSLMGILLANKVPDLSTLHLEFSIVVVFLVMAVMLILSWFELGSAILLAGFSGMWIAALFDQAED